MAVPLPLTREILEKISKDPRWIRTMEQLFDLIPSDTDVLSGKVEEVQFEAGLAAARAQQALDAIKNQYGIFFDTTDQVASATDTPTAVVLNTTQIAKGISVSGSQVSVIKTGLYEIAVRVQV